MNVKDTNQIAAAIAAIPLQLERVRAELAEGLQAFHQGVPLTGARYVPVGATGANTLAWAGAARLLGWSVRAADGPVTVVVRDSRTASGEIIACIELAQNASETIWLGTTGVSLIEGLYIQATSTGAGVIQGAMYLGAVD